MIDKEILDGFKEESNQLLEELMEVVEKLEIRSTTFPKDHLEQFAQRIDRIMGSAKTMSEMDTTHMGLLRIGKIAELCKRMGYMAAETKNPRVVPIFAAFWADTVDVIQDLVNALEDAAKTDKLLKSFTAILQGRLEWLAKQVAAMKPEPIAAEVSQAEIDKSMAATAKVAAEDVPDVAEEDSTDDGGEIGGESFAALMKDLEFD